MQLFEDPKYNRFFNPLCCRNRKIYFECIKRLIDESKGNPTLYENDARDSLTLYFRNLTYAVEDEEFTSDISDCISSSKTETENANAIIRYFRHCGWISEKELARNGDNKCEVTIDCMRLIDAINNIFNRDSKADLTNYIFSIYEELKSVFDPDSGRTVRPWSNILQPAYDNVVSLKNELHYLRESVRSIMRIVIEKTEAKELGMFLSKDEVMKKFFADYFFIKHEGMIPIYVNEILNMLNEVPNTAVYLKMIKEYQESKGVTESQAGETVGKTLEEIRCFIMYDYAKEIDRIEKSMNDYYGLAAARMALLISGGINMQTYINDMLTNIKKMDPEERKGFLQAISGAFKQTSYRYISPKSFERKKKRSKSESSYVIVQDTLTEDEKADLTEEMLHKKPDRYSAEEASKYFSKRISGSQKYTLGKSDIKTRDDAMMIAAGMIYAGTKEFPFDIELMKGTVETDIATISNIKLTRREKNV